MNRSRCRLAAAAGLLWLVLGGCTSTPPPLPPGIASHQEPAEVASEPSVLDVYDPLEPLNRAIYNFNAGFDRYIFLPIVRAYDFITPDFLANRVSDFFDNLTEIPTFANSLLQLKPEVAARAATRFVINTLFTGGLFDLAAEPGGVPQQPEDFGQTLGYWGLGPGPYLVIPVLGPSNLRDTTGIVVEALGWWWLTPREVSETLAYNAVRFGLQPIDLRYRTAFRYYQTGSPFEYELIRLLFTEKRKLDVAN